MEKDSDWTIKSKSSIIYFERPRSNLFTYNVWADLTHIGPVLDNDEENGGRVDHERQEHQKKKQNKRNFVVYFEQREIKQGNDKHKEENVVVGGVL